MVPIVRSFISVPAGVVRMPLAAVPAVHRAGSLIWNSVLIGAGVALGTQYELVERYVGLLDYALVAAVVGFLAVGRRPARPAATQHPGAATRRAAARTSSRSTSTRPCWTWPRSAPPWSSTASRPPCWTPCSPGPCSPGSPATVTGRWFPFRAAFDAALAQLTDLSPADRGQVAGAFLELAPHPDVEPALRRLTEAGVRVVTLTHGSPGVAEAGLSRGGVTPLVERTLSTESIRAWKPARETYLWAAGVCDVPPERMALVACHSLGRPRRPAVAGLTGAFVPRTERVYAAVYGAPHVQGGSLVEVGRRAAGPARVSRRSPPRWARPGCTGTTRPARRGHAGARPRRRRRAASSPDLVAVAAAGCAAGWRVLRVEQPWRVAGKRIAPAPPRLDEGWTAVLAALRARADRPAGAGRPQRRGPGGLPDGGGGRARRGCWRWRSRCTRRGGRRRAGRPSCSGVAVPLLVVQGETDAFGGPAEVAAALAGHAGRRCYAVPGDHALKKDPAAVAAAPSTGCARSDGRPPAPRPSPARHCCGGTAVIRSPDHCRGVRSGGGAG